MPIGLALIIARQVMKQKSLGCGEAVSLTIVEGGG